MKSTKLIVMITCLFALAISAKEQSPTSTFDPISFYSQSKFEGFTVLINPKAAAHEKEARLMWTELEKQLQTIVKVVPDQALREFRKARIWVEWEQTDGGCCFHPSGKWLSENGYNPEKAGDIEICNTKHFINWSEKYQPCMILHEMAHAYHHKVLGLKDDRVTNAFKNAEKEKLYESVAHVDGRKPRKAYAMTNKKEYFSELTEAYFGRNDFYPFNRAELKEHDPVGYRMMVDCWGVSKE